MIIGQSNPPQNKKNKAVTKYSKLDKLEVYEQIPSELSRSYCLHGLVILWSNAPRHKRCIYKLERGSPKDKGAFDLHNEIRKYINVDFNVTIFKSQDEG